MSESAEEKTKRRFVECANLGIWNYQYSFFHNNPDTAKDFAERDKQGLKRILSRKFKQPFLYRLCLSKRGRTVVEHADEDTGEIISHIRSNGELVPYHMFLTTKKLPTGFWDDIKDRFDVDLDMAYRTKSSDQVEKYAQAVLKQKPHNLKRFFGDKKINRIALLNVALIPQGEAKS